EEQLRQEEESRRAEAVVCYSDQDYEVLTRIVQSEAGVCSMKGKILVANVVINRVRDEEFPDDITEVVYQRNQFSPVGNGAINRCSVSEETREAVDRALSGEDYSDGALYFMNRRASQSGNVRWFDGSLTYLFQYEGHEFFK
ncbi:MAG: cell wall hydrolase, partial [Clostridiales bacterium]|nr:cell wall hydrolase [Clostridiales bacterium]